MKYLFAVFVLLAPVSAFSADQDIVRHLQNVSVTIKAGRSEGSGFLKTRTIQNNGKEESISFCWTAAHVVDGLRKTRTVIDSKSGTSKTIVEFDDAQIVQELNEAGRRVGEVKMDAQVIRYSDADTGEDLAVLLVRKRNFVDKSVSVQFYLGEDIPAVGTELYHLGSLLGQSGAGSLTSGLISQHGRVLPNGKVFDQSSAVAFPGSSGGLLSLKSNGMVVGQLVRGAGEGFNLYVPVRRIREWAKNVQIEYAMDDVVPMPALHEITKQAIDDAGSGKISDKSDQKFLIRINSEE